MQGLEWVAVDWGTSSLRLWGMNASNDVLFEHTSDQGMNGLACAEDFEHLLLSILNQHAGAVFGQQTPLPILCCGMVGAKQGWHDADYQTLPWQPSQWPALAKVTSADARIQVYIIPGLCQDTPADVMRGEETQLAGWLAQKPDAQVACLPGTHSKWVRIQNHAVTAFHTFMTGEMYALLAKQSVLRFSVPDDVAIMESNKMSTLSADEIQTIHDDVFAQIIIDVQANPQRVCEWLFSIRAKDILAFSSRHGVNTAATRLSALLIGQEFMATQDLWRNNEVAFIGNNRLTKRYQLALSTLNNAHLKQTCHVYDGDALVLHGLQTIYQHIIKP